MDGAQAVAVAWSWSGHLLPVGWALRKSCSVFWSTRLVATFLLPLCRDYAVSMIDA
jgi:hypothetical protein